MKSKSIFNRLFGLLLVLNVTVLMALYVPRMRTVHFALPKLESWTVESTSELQIQLPEAFRKNLTICFWSNHQGIKVYLNEREIYDGSRLEDERFSEIEASRWNRVEIPPFSDGKVLTVQCETENLPFVKEYVYGTNEQINRWIYQHYGMMQLIDVGTIGIGVFFIFIAFSNKKHTASRQMPMNLGYAMVLLGLFFRTSLKGIPIYWMSEAARDMISYLTFFTLTIPMLSYVKRKVKITGIYIHVCEGTMCFQMAAVTVIFVLHGLGLFDISRFVWFGALFWVLFVVLSFFGAVYSFIKRRGKITLLALISAFVLVLMIPLEAVRAYFLHGAGEYGTIFRWGILIIIVFEVLTYSLIIQELEDQQGKAEQENKRLQFQLLSSQIRPHFILNTLGAIRSMIMEDAEKASDLLYDFSKYLRKNIEEKDYMKPIPFLEELDYIETYLRLEQTRFGERLKVEYHVEEKEFWVLPLTIQPFVENAVKHGLFPQKNGGTIRLSSYKQNDHIVIEIKDDGIGFESSDLQKFLDNKKSVGLRSAIYRIESEMRGKCSITSSTKDVSGTFVRVVLPK